jgi:rubredoxin-NAD+ reductase
MDIIIIGSGLAGYNFVKEFRKLDTQTSITIITEDDGSFYSKPMLSTSFNKNKTAEQLAIKTAEQMADSLNVTIRCFSHVTGIDTAVQRVFIGQEALKYDSLILACGTDANAVPLTGDAVGEIMSVNALDDYRRLRAKVNQKQPKNSHVVIMGVGLIGCEYANDLSSIGVKVTMVAPNQQIIENMLPEPMAQAVQHQLEKQGVIFKLGTLATNVAYLSSSELKLSLSDNSNLTANILLSAIGLKPRIKLAAQAGIAVDKGIKTDRYLRTSERNIYALGDCAQVNGLNLQYILPLMIGARALAKTLSGENTAIEYGPMPIAIKTTACPAVVCNSELSGRWKIQGKAPNLQARLFQDRVMVGFALTGDRVSEKTTLLKTLLS